MSLSHVPVLAPLFLPLFFFSSFSTHNILEILVIYAGVQQGILSCSNSTEKFKFFFGLNCLQTVYVFDIFFVHSLTPKQSATIEFLFFLTFSTDEQTNMWCLRFELLQINDRRAK